MEAVIGRDDRTRRAVTSPVLEYVEPTSATAVTLATVVLVVLSTVLFQFTTVLKPPFGLVALLPFFLVIGLMVGLAVVGRDPQLLSLNARPALVALLSVFVLLQLLAVVRGFLGGSITIGALRFELVALSTLFAFGALAFWKGWVAGASITTWVGASAIVFVGINVLLSMIGIRGDPTAAFVQLAESDAAVMLGSLGIDTDRVAMRLSSGRNSFGVPAGAALVVGAMWLTSAGRAQRKRVAGAIGVLVGCAGILMVDSRGALVMALLGVVAARVGMLFPRLLRLIPILAPLMPAIAVPLLLITSSGDAFSMLARSGSDLGTLNGRLVLWSMGAAELVNFSPRHLLGYGMHGQLLSGVSLNFPASLGGWEKPEYLSFHNAYLQHIFDIGYVGLGVLIAVSTITISHLCQVHRTNPRIGADVLIALLAYYLLYGNLEVPTALVHEGFTLFLLVLIAGAGLSARRTLLVLTRRSTPERTNA